MTSVYRPELKAALRLFARASRAMVERGCAAPILVGGAAVELYTAGAISTGDLDIVTPQQELFEDILRDLGFNKPIGVGHTPLGWVHPNLGLGFEVVSATLLDGMADGDRVVLVGMGDDGAVSIISVEDMIADRMGQFASGTAPEMLKQAVALFTFHPEADLEYLDRRIRFETGGDYGVAQLQS